MENNLQELIENIKTEDITVVDKLQYMVDFIRPECINGVESCSDSIDQLIELFEKEHELFSEISDEINTLFLESKISSNISNLGILSKNGFKYEISERFYNKFLPKPPQKGDLRYILATLFYKKDDHKWVCSIDDEIWIKLFSCLFSKSKHVNKTKNYLFSELLYAAEILSIWIASEEFDENFIRLDKSFLNSDSAFIALQREISNFVNNIQSDEIDIKSIKFDLEHIEVLIQQCKDQVVTLKKRSVKSGISIDLTYQLERLTQINQRLEDILELITKFETDEANHALVELFKEAVVKNATKNSLSELYGQGIRIVAKSVANNTSEHGDHYITSSVKEYFKMFLSAAGAGIIIALMALVKINIVQASFSQEIQTLLVSLNYGLGFVLIHLFGFTVATKQPAMTASSFAEAVKKDEGKRTANQKKLVKLFFLVSRSQFAAVLGNVTLALAVTFAIAYYITSKGNVILNESEVEYYLSGLEPVAALFFAAIAGFWLFFSGLISGYFDNRADLLELKQRYYHLPLFKKLFNSTRREKLAEYLHDHHGAIAGNFFFGVLLGITPYLGYLLDLPLDIRHVAFSSAYLGISYMHMDMSTYQFLYFLECVLLIGAVNLVVSFMLALKISLLSRDTYFGNLFSFLKLLVIEIFKRPHELILPFGNKDNKRNSDH
jgi:site-specific recombinase